MNPLLPKSSDVIKELISPKPIEITKPIKRKRVKWKRNWPCVCGSGIKFKRCCIKDIQALDSLDGNEQTEG